MSEINKEQFDQLPDFVKTEYVEDGDGYSHKGMLKVKETANQLDTKVKSFESEMQKLQESNKTLSEQLANIQKQKQEQAEQEKREGLEKAKSQKDVDAVVKQYEEKIEHLQKQQGETQKQFEERIEKMSGTIKSEKRSSIVSDIASQLTTPQGSKRFKQIVSSMIEVNADTGEVTYLDDEGRATSLDQKGFIEYLKKDDSLWPLLKADVVTEGGGNLNGNGQSRAPSGSQNKAADEAKKSGDVAGFIKANLKG